MPDNQDSVMLVRRYNGTATPGNWTKISGQDLIARRVSWSDYRKLHVNAGNGSNPMKAISLHVYRQNGGGSTPFKTTYSGQAAYGVEHDSTNNELLVTEFETAGNGQANRDSHKDYATGGNAVREIWGEANGQIPAQGVVAEDADESTSLINTANALDTDDVSLG